MQRIFYILKNNKGKIKILNKYIIIMSSTANRASNFTSSDSDDSGAPNHLRDDLHLIEDIFSEPVKKTRCRNKQYKFVQTFDHTKKATTWAKENGWKYCFHRTGIKGDFKFYYSCQAAKKCPRGEQSRDKAPYKISTFTWSFFGPHRFCH